MDDRDELFLKTSIIKCQIKKGFIYKHHKNCDHKYIIYKIGVMENINEIAIIYKALYCDRLTWVRIFQNFCEKVSYNNIVVNRFELV